MNPDHEDPRCLYRDVHRAHQSWCYTAAWQHGPERLKVEIRRNAYDEQSHLLASVWSPADRRWSPITSLPIDAAECRSVSYVDEGITAGHFERDERVLLERAALVLHGTAPRSPRPAPAAPEGHAPEPWAETGMAIVQDASGRIVADCDSPDLPAEMHRANGRRLAAAVTACAGIPTAELEQGLVRDLQELARRVVRAKDEGAGIPAELHHAARRLEERCRACITH